MYFVIRQLYKAVLTLIYILLMFYFIYHSIHIIHNQFSLYINLYINKKQQIFLLHNDNLHSIYIFQIESDLKGISQEFILFLKSLNNSIFNIS